jgi:hypothetical protein
MLSYSYNKSDKNRLIFDTNIIIITSCASLLIDTVGNITPITGLYSK